MGKRANFSGRRIVMSECMSIVRVQGLNQYDIECALRNPDVIESCKKFSAAAVLKRHRIPETFLPLIEEFQKTNKIPTVLNQITYMPQAVMDSCGNVRYMQPEITTAVIQGNLPGIRVTYGEFANDMYRNLVGQEAPTRSDGGLQINWRNDLKIYDEIERIRKTESENCDRLFIRCAENIGRKHCTLAREADQMRKAHKRVANRVALFSRPILAN